ncbi:MAG: glutamate synthase subunit beta [Spirochaetes bacterium]|nr:glutamate synthase subunit beta [Spirochaetota bacterium]
MGHVRGFLEYSRKNASYKPVTERIKNYKEFVEYLSDENIQVQASRCMDCGVPFCHSNGCPVYNLIPEWNDLVFKGKWKEALERLEMTNFLPEITGRICPAPCESSCTLSINDSPVSIKQIELAIIEKGFQNGWVKPHPPENETGRKIAVIGSGPAGLTAASSLRRLGHEVTLFDKSEQVGGLLRYGIPDFKLEKYIIDRRVNLMKEEGIKFETDVNIGEDLSARYLQKSFDVILLTMGAERPRDLRVPGRGFEGIHFAMEYLIQSNKYVSGETEKERIISAGNKTVLVIGGGDTGSDCVGTAHRQGAKKVYQFEIMPKPLDWKHQSNPAWPAWPVILRTSSSHQEGAERDWSILTKSFSGRGISVEQVHCIRVEWQKDKKTGIPKMVEIPGSEFSLKVDLVLLAMGFVHVDHNKLLSDLKVELDEKDNIKINEKYATSVPGVYAAGDSSIGASLVVRAIFHGLQAARSIHEYLKTRK